jgi:hypothetical protein
MMAYNAAGYQCPKCNKKVIEHRYSNNGETFAEILHQNKDGSIFVCGIGAPFSMFLTDSDHFLLTCDKERARRQRYWRGRQLPRQFINQKVVPLIEADDHGKTRNKSFTDDVVKSTTALKPADAMSEETTSGGRS